VPELRGWNRDPFGIHEYRFFSDDGKATLLVRDGDLQSYDKPPQYDKLPQLEQLQQEPTIASPALAPAPAPQGPAQRPASPAQPTPTPAPAPAVRRQRAPDVPLATPGVVRSLREANRNSDVKVQAPRHPHDPARHPMPVLSRTARVAYTLVLAAMAASAVALLVTHLGGTKGDTTAAGSTTTTTKTTTTTTTTVGVPSTTAPVPSAPQPSAAVAAAALISSWATGNRAEALTVATTSAVTALFAGHYTSGLAIDRGCSDAFSPIVCSYGPPGGAAPTDPIYQIDVVHAPTGWYVTSVTINN
jgi:hypothetical protein